MSNYCCSGAAHIARQQIEGELEKMSAIYRKMLLLLRSHSHCPPAIWGRTGENERNISEDSIAAPEPLTLPTSKLKANSRKWAQHIGRFHYCSGAAHIAYQQIEGELERMSATYRKMLLLRRRAAGRPFESIWKCSTSDHSQFSSIANRRGRVLLLSPLRATTTSLSHNFWHNFKKRWQVKLGKLVHPQSSR